MQHMRRPGLVVSLAIGSFAYSCIFLPIWQTEIELFLIERFMYLDMPRLMMLIHASNLIATALACTLSELAAYQNAAIQSRIRINISEGALGVIALVAHAKAFHFFAGTTPIIAFVVIQLAFLIKETCSLRKEHR